MPLYRFRIRTLMIAVAIAGLVCAAFVCKARRERFGLIAAQRTGVFPPVSFADLMGPDAARRSRWGREVMAWHAMMAASWTISRVRVSSALHPA